VLVVVVVVVAWCFVCVCVCMCVRCAAGPTPGVEEDATTAGITRNTMTAMLVSVAELSSIFPVLAVLIFFCAVFLFLMR